MAIVSLLKSYRKSITEDAQDFLILSALYSDDTASEKILAETTGVSLRNLKESLRSLYQAGLVRVRPGGVYFLSDLGERALSRCGLDDIVAFNLLGDLIPVDEAQQFEAFFAQYKRVDPENAFWTLRSLKNVKAYLSQCERESHDKRRIILVSMIHPDSPVRGLIQNHFLNYSDIFPSVISDVKMTSIDFNYLRNAFSTIDRCDAAIYRKVWRNEDSWELTSFEQDLISIRAMNFISTRSGDNLLEAAAKRDSGRLIAFLEAAVFDALATVLPIWSGGPAALGSIRSLRSLVQLLLSKARARSAPDFPPVSAQDVSAADATLIEALAIRGATGEARRGSKILQEAWKLSEVGDQNGAIAAFREVIGRISDTEELVLNIAAADALLAMASIYISQGRFADAVKTYDEVVSRFERSAVPELREKSGKALSMRTLYLDDG